MTYFITASLDSAESQCIRSERHVTRCRGGQVELVVWLAQMVPAMPSILGDQSNVGHGTRVDPHAEERQVDHAQCRHAVLEQAEHHSAQLT